MEVNLKDYVEKFHNTIKDLPYGPSGMFNSEIFVVYSLYKELKCDLFIESGLDWGISTKKFLSLIEDEYIGIDVNEYCQGKNQKSKNFKFIHSDSSIVIPEIINNNPNKNIFIMIDGPKGNQAIELKNKFLEYENVKCIGMHDTYDGLEDEHNYRIFETKNNSEYKNIYFDYLNNISGVVNIYNLMNYNNKTYYETFPSGPGVSIYSKSEINFIL